MIGTLGDTTPTCILISWNVVSWRAECWTVMLVERFFELFGRVVGLDTFFGCQEFHAVWFGDFASHGFKRLHAAATWQCTSVAHGAETNISHEPWNGQYFSGFGMRGRCYFQVCFHMNLAASLQPDRLPFIQFFSIFLHFSSQSHSSIDWTEFRMSEMGSPLVFES